jgi:hypothetical protein
VPYIPNERRVQLSEPIRKLEQALCKKGEYNYAITKLFIGYIKKMGISYDHLSDVSGILDDIKYEFKRQVTDPYENAKAKENGDLDWPHKE